MLFRRTLLIVNGKLVTNRFLFRGGMALIPRVLILLVVIQSRLTLLVLLVLAKPTVLIMRVQGTRRRIGRYSLGGN